ncbi:MULTISPECIES: ABC transporter ATP-binding protein [Hungatella]|uniref:ABC transporter ATP-binding protein n=1 Tax=Hungatella TaxID=1649459 RepID=UPI0003A9BC5E|nr:MULTISPECIES: ABC transporter ATP-binding protein [Hungatella]
MKWKAGETLEQDVLRMEGITKIYGNGILANDNVDFYLRQGEIHALMGENGAGKSTLMKILFGMEKPTSGKIILNGTEVSIPNSASALSMGIGMVHQHFMLVPSLTVTENLILGNEPHKGALIDLRQAREKVRELSETYHFALDPDARVKDLSVGMKQQIEILKALYRGAKILILDEPTAVLTPQETEVLFKQLKNLRDNGHVLIFISHKIREVIEICDRVTIMRSGKSMGVYNIHGDALKGTKDITEEEISRLMVGRSAILELNKTPAEPKDIVLKVKGALSVDLERKVRVNHVNFTVRKGEILGVAGVEGNGQAELVSMITGMMPLDQGDVTIEDISIKEKTIRQIRTELLSYIPQDRLTYGVVSGTDIRNNLIPFLTERKEYRNGILMKTKALKKLADEVAKDYSVKCDSSEQYVGMLSGGNMQKVVAARELSDRTRKIPPLIVADQPSRGIDIGATTFIHRKLLELRDAGCGVLLISADLNEILELSDSVIVLYDGEISGYFPDTRKLTERELGQYMLGVKRQTEEEVGGVCHGAI